MSSRPCRGWQLVEVLRDGLQPGQDQDGVVTGPSPGDGDDDQRHGRGRVRGPGDRRDADQGEQLVDDAEFVVEHQPEDRGIGDLADHDGCEEGKAEQPARLEQRRMQQHGQHRRQRDHDRHLHDEDDQRVLQRIGEGRIDQQATPVGLRRECPWQAARVEERHPERADDRPHPESEEDQQIGRQETIGGECARPHSNSTKHKRRRQTDTQIHGARASSARPNGRSSPAAGVPGEVTGTGADPSPARSDWQHRRALPWHPDSRLRCISAAWR